MGGGRQRLYSVNSDDYKLLEEVGYGASAVVHRAIYLPFNQVVAVKCLDLDRCNVNLDDIRREAQTMVLIDHPNVIKAFCSFVVDHNLWVVMPFMAEGSCLHLMKTAYPDGFEESAIGSILKDTLRALEYLHREGHIHRDVKAGNILLDSNGDIKLGDFGVSACMFDTGDRQRSRNTFVGTPCWMAPEVLQPGTGYDFKADIWSFGITALELAHGHAPFSKYPPMKVLLMTIQNAPPGLDYDRDKKFSKSFKEMVAMCLVKDQNKRPTAEKLLKHSFFKHTKPPALSVKKLFAGLPPLWDRVKALQLKDAAQLALKRMPSSEEEALSQTEYQRGVSEWNFDLEDLKFQASLVQDEDDIQESKEEDETTSYLNNIKEGSSSRQLGVESLSTNGITDSEQEHFADFPGSKSQEKGNMIKSDMVEFDRQVELKFLARRQTQSGPMMPGAFVSQSAFERARNVESLPESKQPLEKVQQVRRAPSFSGPLMLPKRASANSLSAPIKSSGGFGDFSEDKSKANLVQIRGRFSVTSENVDLVKDIPSGIVLRQSSQGLLKKSASVGNWIHESKIAPTAQPIREAGDNIIPASLLMPALQNLLHQISIQQDLIMNLLSSMQAVEVADASENGKLPSLLRNLENNGSVEAPASERERLLLIKISELQARMANLTEELNAERLRYMQLQQRLNLEAQENNGNSREFES
ncbi:non-receptor serine/threonine protein kinase [Lithospermum erythrorhizon]|uniref:Non-receptor serine/threonine protein kinase n=1 Tax=Lithospermum erythrorhizon TaxID=34254 RepID=A0AAV3PUV7_LITER